MSCLARIAVCVMLLVGIQARAADARVGPFVSLNLIQKIFYSSCGEDAGWRPAGAPLSSVPQVVAPTFLLLSKPQTRETGLNVNSACLASGQIKLLRMDPRSWKPALVPYGPVTFCGIAYDGEVQIRVCTNLGHFTGDSQRPYVPEPSQSYKRWLDEDVRWIITDEERYAFKHLSNDEECDDFIEAFWQRRNPNPGSEENECKEEHYRRLVFANEQFASFVPGWKTDRGRIYIMFGPPDEIESHASGGTYAWSVMWQTISNRPFQVWHYRYLKGLGEDVTLIFIDTCNCGDYILTDAPPDYVAVASSGSF